MVFAALLVVAAVAVPRLAADAIQPLRMAGPAVKRWSGWVMVVVGGWFFFISVAPQMTGIPLP